MPTRHVARGRRGGTTRRRTTWATHQSTETFAAANDRHTISLLDNYTSNGGVTVGITTARTIIHLAVTSSVTAADRLNVGLIRGQSSDVGTNIAGAPDPASDPYEDWAWLEQYDASTSGGGPLYGKWGSNVISIDTQAKRKLMELHMDWNLVLHSSVTATWQLYARTLILLP